MPKRVKFSSRKKLFASGDIYNMSRIIEEKEGEQSKKPMNKPRNNSNIHNPATIKKG